jgi:phosphoribosylamine--glycine ligase
MGDPETEVVLPRIKTDFVEMMKAVTESRLHEVEIEVDPRAATTIILASGGYPGAYEKGKIISGLDKTSGSLIFHAGTISEGQGILSSGGRVIAVTSLGNDFREALAISNTNAALINFEGKYYRRDIGFDL